MSLKFLNLKSFHPGNKKSQKSLYIAEEKQKEDKRKEEDRAKEVLAEQEYVKNRQLLSGSRLEAERSKVSFLYTLPPGAAPIVKDDQLQPPKKDKDLHDYEKFPVLVNAPTHGSISSDAKLVHKPLGVLINNVKCLRCGVWGHRSGDRECALIDLNPLEQRNLRMNDPMYNSNSNGSNGNSDNTEYKKKFRLNNGAASPKSFGSRNLNNNYSVNDMVGNDNKQQQQHEDDEDDDQVEREFLASLTKKQRKLLLRQIKLEEKEAKEKKKKRGKRENYSDSSDDEERVRKKRKHKSSSSSSLKRKSSKHSDNDDNMKKEKTK